MKEDYKSQYKHPNWQKKRLEMFQKHDYTCLMCKSKEKTLHLHHTYYVPGRKVWDYPSICFLVLCDACHEKQHNSRSFNVFEGIFWEADRCEAFNQKLCDLVESVGGNNKTGGRSEPVVVDLANDDGLLSVKILRAIKEISPFTYTYFREFSWFNWSGVVGNAGHVVVVVREKFEELMVNEKNKLMIRSALNNISMESVSFEFKIAP